HRCRRRARPRLPCPPSRSFLPILQCRPERVLKRLQPGFKGPPLVDTIAVYRAPDLLGAGGADGAGGAVKLQRGGVEGYAGMVKEAADLRLEILDQALVDGVVYLAGQHPVEMAHEAEVVGVIMADAV